MSASQIQRPNIVVTNDDHEVLIDLAHKALGRAPGAAMLLEEMERATLVPTGALPAGVLAMNGAVAFDYDGRAYRDFRLVHPAGADFAAGRISVLTPVGAALIGLSEGQSISWPDQDGSIHRLTVTQVGAPPA